MTTMPIYFVNVSKLLVFFILVLLLVLVFFLG